MVFGRENGRIKMEEFSTMFVLLGGMVCFKGTPRKYGAFEKHSKSSGLSGEVVIFMHKAKLSSLHMCEVMLQSVSYCYKGCQVGWTWTRSCP